MASPQKKPLAGALLKTYSHRPNSAIRTKYDPDLSSHSPTRNESKSSKKLSMSRNPSSTSTRPIESRSHIFRRKNEEGQCSSSLSKSTSKWDKHLSIETNGGLANNSNL